jgi:transketolase
MTTPAAEKDVELLRKTATAVRRRSLQMVHAAKVGHPGGDLSGADILVALYFSALKVDPKQPLAVDRDRFVMSKGHCSASFYATLALAGYFPESLLDEYMGPLSMLNGHPDRNKVSGVEANTGALGHGLPVAVGMALGAKMAGQSWRTFVLTGDGELQEGSNWEAIMSAAHYGLDNLTVIVDRNTLQQGDRTENTVRLEPLADKWRAFGWAVNEIDGNDMPSLLQAFGRLPFESGKPNCLIAHTRKGKGVSFIEDRPEWHHHVPSDAQLAAALIELSREDA